MQTSPFKLFGLLFILALGVLFIISPDSYTHDLFFRIDTAWFFTCGKAWMNGMIPYIDFADSKGPLLWLIYGIGYLLSPHNYLGMFWLSVVLYAIIFYYVYKTAFIFLKDTRHAFFVVLLMIAAFFCKWYHYEIRAEDWALLFIALLFYHLCRFLYTDEGKSDRHVFLTCFLYGVSMAATLLIKYNITVMLGLLALYVLYALIRERKNILLAVLTFVAGLLLVIAPFYLYMLSAGNLDAFIREYFLNTMQTIDSFNNSSMYVKEWLFLTYDPLYVILFTVCCAGALMMAHRVRRYNHFFLLSFLAFYAIAIHHSSSYRIQYMCICLFFPIWLCIGSVGYLQEKYAASSRRILCMSSSVLILYTLFSNMFTQGYVNQDLFFMNNDGRQWYYEAAYYMSQVKKPTIIYYTSMEKGIGTPVDALPGTRYWSSQMGATQEMLGSQLDGVRKGTADFILVSDFSQPLALTDSILHTAGYHPVHEHQFNNTHQVLYSRHVLRPLPHDFRVSNWDVLLKRKIFN